jgi:transposase
MTLSRLSPHERALLAVFAARTREAKALRRAQALLWLDHGESLVAVATRLAVTRQTVYNWVKHFHTRRPAALGERLADGLRSGRPPTVQERIDPLLEAVLPQDPRALGYRSTTWTAPLLTQYLRDSHALTVSRQSVSLALARLDVRWKRPRHRLAHRSPTWRQGKGGSNGDSEDVPARSCGCSMKRSSPRCLPCLPVTDDGGSKSRCLSPAIMPGACSMARSISEVVMGSCWSPRPGITPRIKPSWR